MPRFTLVPMAVEQNRRQITEGGEGRRLSPSSDEHGRRRLIRADALEHRVQPAGSRVEDHQSALQRPGRGSTFPVRPRGWCRQFPANAAAAPSRPSASHCRIGNPPRHNQQARRRCSSVVVPGAFANSQPSAVRADSCHTPGRAAENRGWRISMSVSSYAPTYPARDVSESRQVPTRGSEGGGGGNAEGGTRNPTCRTPGI